jgi:uncharacterized phosphosugar-binding protein
MMRDRTATRVDVRARLRELIATSQPGDRLPSERALSARWRVARQTVRAATDALVREGLVQRRHGSGTYVLPPPSIRSAASTPSGVAEPGSPAGRRYLYGVAALVARIVETQWAALDAAATRCTHALAAGRQLHAFGSGHSHMLAEELYYRAGGLVDVRPILFEGLMLHGSAPLSTALERLPGLAKAVIDDHAVEAGDVLLIASNSGSNAVVTEMARAARQQRLAVIAITSLEHATSAAGRQARSPRLHELADVVIDNGGMVGDASIELDGLPTRVGPTSTVVGAAIANALVAEIAERLLARGITPRVFSSSNVAGGDARNAPYLDRPRSS